jgi:hypothetical protein
MQMNEGRQIPNLRIERYLSMLDQMTEFYDILLDRGEDFVRELIYPIREHVLQYGAMLLIRKLEPDKILAAMDEIRMESDREFVSFVATGIVFMRERRPRSHLRQQLEEDLVRIFGSDEIERAKSERKRSIC